METKDPFQREDHASVGTKYHNCDVDFGLVFTRQLGVP